MSNLNMVPSGERIKIAIFGKRNAGKSSLINALTNQDLAIVSPVLGTTTDPVEKNMELLPLGAVTLVDTPGIDDTGDLGQLRVEKAYQWLDKSDIVLLVLDSREEMDEMELALLSLIKQRGLPYLLVWNKKDLLEETVLPKKEGIYVSAETKEGIEELKEALGKFEQAKKSDDLLSGVSYLKKKIVLVIPIDKAAPKGRIIHPQQQAIRAALDRDLISVVLTPQKLASYLETNQDTDLVICDSQVFKEVSALVPEEIPLTSFSILMARYRGDFKTLIEGVLGIEHLKDGDTILIAEGCTHHRQCEDIGTVKLPRWIQAYNKKTLNFAFTSGGTFPKDLSEYALVVHCGGCMLGRAELISRIGVAKSKGVPMTNYGVLIAYMNGILKRTLSPFEEVRDLRERINQ